MRLDSFDGVLPRKGHVECLKEVIAAGADINKENNYGRTALMFAASQGHVDSSKILIDGGSDINKQNGDGDTPLMISASVPNPIVVKYLLSKGADVNFTNYRGETALYQAISHAHTELQFDEPTEPSISTRTMFELLKAGAKLDETTATAYLKMTTKPNTYVLNMLVAAGAKLKESRLFEVNCSLQHLARKYIRQHLVQLHPEKNLYNTIPQLGLPHRLQAYLLFYMQQTFRTNLKKEEEHLLQAVKNNHRDSVLKLIQVGMDLNVQDENGITALMIACENSHVQITVDLMKAGANLNIQAYNGNTALIYATKEMSVQLVKELISFGASVNIQGENGETALMHALFGNGQCLEALVEAGINPDISNHDGYTALGLAIHWGKTFFFSTI